MKQINKILGLGLVLGTLGCGAKSTSESGRKADEIDTNLAGSWQTACNSADWLGMVKSQSTYGFSAVGDFDKSSSYYTDNCVQSSFEVALKGTTSSLGDSKSVAGAKDINFTITTATLTSKTDNATTLLNAGTGYCGKKDWKTGEKTDILGKDCAGGSYKNGAVIFDVYKIEKSILTLGKSGMIWGTKKAADQRPTELDVANPYLKK